MWKFYWKESRFKFYWLSRHNIINGFKCKKESTMSSSTTNNTITNKCRAEYKTCEDSSIAITEEGC